MRIEIRPRRVTDPRFDLDIYVSIDNLGVADLEKAYSHLISDQTQVFSPFDKISYELQLQLAATHLDSKGVYCPDQIKIEDCRLPLADEELRIINSWVLFARPRSKNIFIQDLENFKKQFNNNQNCEISNVVKVIITEPLSEHPVLKLPNFRGLSSFGCSNLEDVAGITELFFPLPFNEEQVKIVQKLECSNGVVVQGPPGTGKTHTIANIISHYMANGKRVLVTSMKEPALLVLKEKLPKSIQPLAISLLTNEQDGVKQFEFAISKIAQELQVIDRSGLECEIRDAELYIDKLHAKLAWIDRSVNAWAKKNIQPIFMDGQLIYPEEAAREVQKALGQFEWIDDDISITDKNILRIDNKDVIRLREARRYLQNDLDYLGKKIPKIDDVPSLSDILVFHSKLLKGKELQELIQLSNFSKIADISDTVVVIDKVLNILYELEAIKQQLDVTNKPWIESLKLLLGNPDSIKIILLFEKLFDEIKHIDIEKSNFLERPVYLPSDLSLTDEVIQAIRNKSLGKFAFGVAGAFSKRTLMKKINEICILNKLVKTPKEWEYLYRYVSFCARSNQLILRWNKLVDETTIFSPIDVKLSITSETRNEIEIYFSVKKLVDLRLIFKENFLIIFHDWPYHDDILEDEIRLSELMNFLKINLYRHRSLKEQLNKEIIVNELENYTGRVSERVKKFIDENVGNPLFTELEIKSQWSCLLDELVRIQSLRPYLDDVESVSNLILESGGVNWSKKLRDNPLKDTTVDYLLPDNWQQAWRLCRLKNYLRSVAYFDEFKELIS